MSKMKRALRKAAGGRILVQPTLSIDEAWWVEFFTNNLEAQRAMLLLRELGFALTDQDTTQRLLLREDEAGRLYRMVLRSAFEYQDQRRG